VTWRESLARSLPRRYNGLMHRWLNLAIALAVMSAPVAKPPLSAPPRQGGTVPAIMARLTPLEKVGQLFLVTFSGPAADLGGKRTGAGVTHAADRHQFHKNGVNVITTGYSTFCT